MSRAHSRGTSGTIPPDSLYAGLGTKEALFFKGSTHDGFVLMYNSTTSFILSSGNTGEDYPLLIPEETTLSSDA